MVPFVSYYILFMIVLVTGMTAGRWRAVFGAGSVRRYGAWFLAGFVAPYTYFLLTGWGTQMGFEEWLRTLKFGGWQPWRPPMALLAPVWGTAGLFYSFWLAVTVAWMFHVSWEEATKKARRSFFQRVSIPWLVALGTLLIAWWGLYWSGVIVGGIYLFLRSNLSAARADHGVRPRYAQVTIFNNFGKYEEAEREIVNQLEKAPDDFEGWLLLAEVYATKQNDLKGAHEAVMQLVHQDDVSAPQKSEALRKLADWHLNIGENPKAARAALEELIRLLPGTIAAQRARQRLDSMPKDQQEYRQSLEVKPVVVAQVPEPDIRELDRRAPSGRVSVSDAERAEARGELEKVAALESRGRAAEALGDSEEGLDEALRELKTLCELPELPEAQWVRWMHCRARWLWERRKDADGAIELMNEVESRFPKTQLSMAARTRRQRIEFERGQGEFFRPKAV